MLCVMDDAERRNRRVPTRSVGIRSIIHPSPTISHVYRRTLDRRPFVAVDGGLSEGTRIGKPSAGRRSAVGRGVGLPADRTVHHVRGRARRRAAGGVPRVGPPPRRGNAGGVSGRSAGVLFALVPRHARRAHSAARDRVAGRGRARSGEDKGGRRKGAGGRTASECSRFPHPPSPIC